MEWHPPLRLPFHGVTRSVRGRANDYSLLAPGVECKASFASGANMRGERESVVPFEGSRFLFGPEEADPEVHGEEEEGGEEKEGVERGRQRQRQGGGGEGGGIRRGGSEGRARGGGRRGERGGRYWSRARANIILLKPGDCLSVVSPGIFVLL